MLVNIRLFSEKRQGCLPVLEQGHLLGLIWYLLNYFRIAQLTNEKVQIFGLDGWMTGTFKSFQQFFSHIGTIDG